MVSPTANRPRRGPPIGRAPAHSCAPHLLGSPPTGRRRPVPATGSSKPAPRPPGDRPVTPASGDRQGGGMSGRIVVGYDGSDDSRVALSWAVAMARKWDVDLVAVSCWVPPMAPGLPQLPPEFLAALEEHTTAALSTALQRMRRLHRRSAGGPPGHPKPSRGRPAGGGEGCRHAGCRVTRPGRPRPDATGRRGTRMRAVRHLPGCDRAAGRDVAGAGASPALIPRLNRAATTTPHARGSR